MTKHRKETAKRTVHNVTLHISAHNRKSDSTKSAFFYQMTIPLKIKYTMNRLTTLHNVLSAISNIPHIDRHDSRHKQHDVLEWRLAR